MTELLETAPLWLPGVIAMIALVTLSACFSSSETAFFYLSRDQVRAFRKGPPRQKRVAELLADPDRLLTAVLFWNLVINLSYFAIGIVVIQRLSGAGYSVAAGAFGFLNLLGMIVFGEVLPKSMAVKFAPRLAPLASFALMAAVHALDPVLPTLGRTAKALRRTFWPHLRSEPHLRAEDLENAINAARLSETGQAPSGEHGSGDKTTHGVLHRILDMQEISVEKIMRPRNRCLILPPDTNLSDVPESVLRVDYVLVHDADSDEIVTGAVPLDGIQPNRNGRLADLAEPVVHVPWCANLAYTLGLLRSSLSNIAVVVHEFGEMVGTVSHGDLLEAMISPEFSRMRRVLRRDPISPIDERTIEMSGLVTLRYLAQRLRIDFDEGETGPVTVSGLLQSKLEHLPQSGDECDWNDCRIVVVSGSDRGDVSVRILLPDHLKLHEESPLNGTPTAADNTDDTQADVLSAAPAGPGSGAKS